MKRTMNLKSRLLTITWYHLIMITIGLSISLIVATMAMAQELVTYEGTIQGLNCVHFQKKCPEEDLDMYIALEHDFVLLLSDGSHFVLPNLDRGIKTRYLTKDVRIRGKQKGNTLWVENLEVKEGQRYRLVWNYQEQKKIEEAN